MFLYGKNSIQERLIKNPKTIKIIYVQENFQSPELFETIKKTRIPVKTVSENALYRIKKADRLQGIVAEVDDYKYTEFEELLVIPGITPIFLDKINDPHNFGAIIRSAACFGGYGIVIQKHGTCQVNDTVMHVSQGGENYIPVSLVTNMTQAILKAKDKGYWIAGTVVENGKKVYESELPFPLCIVMGSEGSGIRYGIEKHLDFRVTLPMKGASLSFNVAMSTSIFCYEISRQKDIMKKCKKA